MSGESADEGRAQSGPGPEPRRRAWWRPGPRAVVEVLAIVAAAAGLAAMRDRGEFPKPSIRALRSGTPAEKEDALRTLSLFGRAGDRAIPALLRSLREDPSPAVRRGAAFVLAEIAAAPEGVEPFTVEQLIAGRPGQGIGDREEGGESPTPHPRIRVVVSGLLGAVREDPDPTVRVQAIAAVTQLLDGATGLRLPANPPVSGSGNMIPPEAPTPAFGVEPWMREAALAIADRAGTAVGDESRKAAAWAFAEPAARVLLDDEQRAVALHRFALGALRGPSTYLDVTLIKAAALDVRDGTGERRAALLDAMARAIAGPRPEGPDDEPANQSDLPHWLHPRDDRPIDPDDHAIPFWMAGPSADELREHPGALDATVRLLPRVAPQGHAYQSRPGSLDSPIEREAARLVQMVEQRELRGNAQNPRWIDLAIERDPSVLDPLGDRLDAEGWRRLIMSSGVMFKVTELLLDPGVASSLPPARAARAAEALDEVYESIPVGPLRRPALAFISYYARGTPEGSESRRRFVARFDESRYELWEDEGRGLARWLALRAAVGGPGVEAPGDRATD